MPVASHFGVLVRLGQRPAKPGQAATLTSRLSITPGGQHSAHPNSFGPRLGLADFVGGASLGGATVWRAVGSRCGRNRSAIGLARSVRKNQSLAR